MMASARSALRASILVSLLLTAVSDDCTGECSSGEAPDKTSLLQAQYEVAPHQADNIAPPHFDMMSAWAGGPPKPGREGIPRDEMLTTLYGKPLNPLANLVGHSCGQNFPFSITEQQLVHVVDPVLEARNRPVVIIEVGVLFGKTSIRMAERIMQKSNQKPVLKDSIVLSVDTWLGDIALWNAPGYQSRLLQGGGTSTDYECYVGNVQASPAKHFIAPMRVPSNLAARLLYQHGVQADLIYVDGSHDYEDVLTDLARFSKILAPCGSLFGDDWHLPPVQAAVKKFAEQEKLHIDLIQMRQIQKFSPKAGGPAAQFGWALHSKDGKCGNVAKQPVQPKWYAFEPSK